MARPKVPEGVLNQGLCGVICGILLNYLGQSRGPPQRLHRGLRRGLHRGSTEGSTEDSTEAPMRAPIRASRRNSTAAPRWRLCGSLPGGPLHRRSESFCGASVHCQRASIGVLNQGLCRVLFASLCSPLRSPLRSSLWMPPRRPPTEGQRASVEPLWSPLWSLLRICGVAALGLCSVRDSSRGLHRRLHGGRD